LGKKLTEEFRSLKPFEDKLKLIGKKLFLYGQRLTFHPNEYACLGSPKQSVIDYSITDLDWHGRMVLMCIEGAKEFVREQEEFVKNGEKRKAPAKKVVKVVAKKGKKRTKKGKKDAASTQAGSEESMEEEENPQDKYNPEGFTADRQTTWRTFTEEAVDAHFSQTVFVLHGGGVYGDKKAAMKRWGETFDNLPKHIKDYVVIENDEKNYCPHDLLPMCEKHDVPMVVDYFHQECYEILHDEYPDNQWSEVIPRVQAIWKKRNKKIKFHISGQQAERRIGTHSHYV
jgi:UV DNA damage repair endonuclease